MSYNHQEIDAQSKAAGTVTQNNQPVLLLSTVVFLFMVTVIIFILYLYAKRKMNHTPSQQISASPQTQIISNGLDKEILKSLPVTVHKAWESKETEECAVCLSEIENGEEMRLLPKCKHGFHLQCIDMWFHSHSTCPLCRCSVTKESCAETTEGGSGIRRGHIVIDIPMRETTTDETVVDSPLPVSKFAEVGEAGNPSLRRLGTLTRLWSRGKMVISAFSPTGHGIDKGVVGEGNTSVGDS